ncbi:DHH family phosphoesterase [Xylanibacillus composti]|uniref:Cyclic-di-AMP phosphodiesterase n=1 Tax=Xylanibacillus composti TaxID=1572762 RepID=A0A8J4H404_9BACL|nr:DHH family phosphoesterase [Xylanibacillus composti]MDT9725254.1 DHH family phosphoesterase [Xylanibacillus composti]GIQ70454.1 DHH family phosphoesterase [Xylanibacillus composti]
MPKFLLRRWRGLPIMAGLILLTLFTAALFFLHWWAGLAALLAVGVLIYYVLAAEQAFYKELNDYIMTLTHRVKKAGAEVVQELPIGMIVYNEEKAIEWHNPYVGKIFDQESIAGELLADVLPSLKSVKDKEEEIHVTVGEEHYLCMVRPEDRLIYLYNITDYTVLAKRYEEERLAIGILMLDNLDEVTQGMDDQSRSLLLAKVIGAITEWANENHIFIRRSASDRFFILMHAKTLKKIEQSKFDILDEVRDLTGDLKLPLTLSIGIATGADQLPELGSLAQSSLDVALGRGGDQAAVKSGQRLSFYGGRSNAVEKRTRVRARVISHALRDLMKESDKVIIMGHRYPDMDSMGAAVGVLKMAQLCGKEGYIVLEGDNPSIHRMLRELEQHESIQKWMITPEQALSITHQRSLAVVVDTHKSSMVAEPKLLQQTGRIVVIDHHRRGEEFIDDAVLIYIEPYASSTCELVTELLQYLQDRLSMEPIEATSLLAGIVVDTKSFSLRTGARTFEAASFLRRNGADSAQVQQMLKEDLDEFIEKSEIIKHTEIWDPCMAVCAAEDEHKYSQLLIAKVADTLLNMTDIAASFVIAERPDGLIGISARSLGKVNVQVIMEQLGGGGHLTNAAAQLEGTIAEAKAELKRVLQEMDIREGLSE